MSPRELIILLLGLAIVAVILRGLYVALQARRGQIRLAIDKNIPTDVDLDALELSELPGGGARVIPRSAEQVAQDKLAAAQTRADAMDMGSGQDQQIPVLMDAVQVNDEPAADHSEEPETDHETESADVSADPDWQAQDDYESSTDDSVEENPELQPWEDNDREQTHQLQRQEPQVGDSSGDDVLLDYDEFDEDDADAGMSSVAPDYEDAPADETGQDTVTEPFADQGDMDESEAESDGWESRDEADPELDEEQDWQAREESVGSETAPQGSVSFEESLDEFSLSAGERIGYENKPSQVQQKSLFDEVDEDIEVPPDRPSRNPLRSTLSRLKSAVQGSRSEPQAPEPEPVTDDLPLHNDDEFVDEVSVAAAPPEPEPEPDQAIAQAAEPVAPPSRATKVEERRVEDHKQSVPAQPSEVLVVNIMARQGREFRGDDLLEALITNGLKFGDMNIFHKRMGVEGKGPTIFSVANALNPGTFDLNQIDDFTTVGISLFLPLPAPVNNLEAFEQMLATARQVQAQLAGDLRDDNRNMMTAQTIEHYRQRIRDFELRQLKAASSRAG